MFTAKVYKVMVDSLSGTMEEEFAAKETIRKWNLDDSERAGKLYMVRDWSMKADQLQDLDVLIGVVGNWVENTSFIENCIKEGKQVMLFFNAYQDPNNTMSSEHETVMAFRSKMQNSCCCAEYNSITDLSTKLSEKLISIYF